MIRGRARAAQRVPALPEGVLPGAVRAAGGVAAAARAERGGGGVPAEAVARDPGRAGPAGGCAGLGARAGAHALPRVGKGAAGAAAARALAFASSLVQQACLLGGGCCRRAGLHSGGPHAPCTAGVHRAGSLGCVNRRTVVTGDDSACTHVERLLRVCTSRLGCGSGGPAQVTPEWERLTAHIEADPDSKRLLGCACLTGSPGGVALGACKHRRIAACVCQCCAAVIELELGDVAGLFHYISPCNSCCPATVGRCARCPTLTWRPRSRTCPSC